MLDGVGELATVGPTAQMRGDKGPRPCGRPGTRTWSPFEKGERWWPAGMHRPAGRWWPAGEQAAEYEAGRAEPLAESGAHGTWADGIGLAVSAIVAWRPREAATSFNDSSNNMHHGNSISPDNQGNGIFIWDQH